MIRKHQFKQKRSEKKETRAERQTRQRHQPMSKKQERERQSERLFQQAGQIEAERRALRRIEITGGDEVALGSKSSGWSEFKEKLKAKLLFLETANIRRADAAASTLNRMGFKTGSGQTWTPRLINVAKMKLFKPKDRNAR